MLMEQWVHIPSPSPPPNTCSARIACFQLPFNHGLTWPNWSLLFYSNWRAMPGMQTCDVSMLK